MGIPLRAVVFLAAATMLLAATPASAAPAGAPVPSGAYEAFSPITHTPVGPIGATQAAQHLGRWLEVTTRGNDVSIVFAPERTIEWRVRYGSRGIEEKRTLVNAVLWSVSTFTYDAQDRLVHKQVTGLASPLAFTYATAPDGRVVERQRTGTNERWTVTYSATGATAETWVGAQLVRRDRYDAAGRVLLTEVGPTTLPNNPTVLFRRGLRYERGANGALVNVWRRIQGEPDRIANPNRHDDAVRAGDIDGILGSGPVERHEVLLLLGAPITHSVTGIARSRVVKDDYGCLINSKSRIVYDPTDLATNGEVTCICGFCVAMPAPGVKGDVLGTDEHWTRGPWVRLDDAVDVTADHEVMTPAGARPAGKLRAGDVVLDARGRPHALRSVRSLGASPRERLGVNVRTKTGTFAAGGLLFASEGARACGFGP